MDASGRGGHAVRWLRFGVQDGTPVSQATAAVPPQPRAPAAKKIKERRADCRAAFRWSSTAGRGWCLANADLEARLSRNPGHPGAPEVPGVRQEQVSANPSSPGRCTLGLWGEASLPASRSCLGRRPGVRSDGRPLLLSADGTDVRDP